MTFEALNEAEEIFIEIANFYASFKQSPEKGLTVLINDPSHATKRALQSIPDYKLNGQDVKRWLYPKRIVPLMVDLEDKVFKELGTVSTDAEKASLTIRLERFRSILTLLQGSLEVYTSDAYRNSFLNDVTDQEDWEEIYVALQFCAVEVLRLVQLYSVIINKFDSQLLALPMTESEPSAASGNRRRKVKLEGKPAPPGHTNLSEMQTLLLMQALRNAHIIYKGDVSDSAVGFAFLTGFSQEQLRQKYSESLKEECTIEDLEKLRGFLDEISTELRDTLSIRKKHINAKKKRS